MYKSDFITCSCNISYTLFIDINNNIWSFGDNSYGQCGYKKKHILPKQIPNLSNIKTIDCGNSFTLCLDFDGNVYSFGDNSNGKLGLDKNIVSSTKPQLLKLPFIEQISCGKNFSLCLSSNKQLWAFGNGEDGQLGILPKENHFLPFVIPNLNDIEDVICSGYKTTCKTYNNEFYTWGYGNHGKLGIGDNNSYPTPQLCKQWPSNIISFKSSTHCSIFLTDDGFTYSFGWNIGGQLGLDESISHVTIPTLIKDLPFIKQIEIGEEHTMCIDLENNLWIFGYNSNSQLGLGDKKNRHKPILHPTLNNVIGLSSGGNHTFVKTSDNKIYAFGNNSHSQLGITSSTSTISTPIQVFENNTDIWNVRNRYSRVKSARK